MAILKKLRRRLLDLTWSAADAVEEWAAPERTAARQQRSSKAAKVLPIGFLIVAAAFIYVRWNATRIEKLSVVGLYRSSCCGDILLSGNQLTYDGKSAKFVLKLSKLGLTAYLDRPVWRAESLRDCRTCDVRPIIRFPLRTGSLNTKVDFSRFFVYSLRSDEVVFELVR